MLTIHQECYQCDFKYKWQSQPLVNKNIPAGNIALSAAILFSGSTPSQALKVFNHMKCQSISLDTFMTHQRKYLFPIIENEWNEKQAETLDELRAENRPLQLAGDGRFL